MGEENNKIFVERIQKSRESRFMVFFFSMFIIVISALVLKKTVNFIPSFLTLVVLTYIISAPQSRLGYYLVDNKLLIGNLKGKKVIELEKIKDLEIIDIPLIAFPFLTNGIGYHVGSPKIKGFGRVEVSAAVFPGKALLIITENEKIAITPAAPKIIYSLLLERKSRIYPEAEDEKEFEPENKKYLESGDYNT